MDGDLCFSQYPFSGAGKHHCFGTQLTSPSRSWTKLPTAGAESTLIWSMVLRGKYLVHSFCHLSSCIPLPPNSLTHIYFQLNVMKEVCLEVSHGRSSFTGLLLLSTIAELIFRSTESPGLLWTPFWVGGNTQYCFLSCASTS